MNPEKRVDVMQRVTIYTDGACRGNPGPGGWAAVLLYRGIRKELTGSARSTTNNRMELTAAIEALSALKRTCAVELFTDSEYLKKGIETWLARWKKRGFRTMDGQPVKNQDLWEKLEDAASRHKVQWNWVRGHAGNSMNELCDCLAREALERGLNPAHNHTAIPPLRKEQRVIALVDGSVKFGDAEFYPSLSPKEESRPAASRMKRARGLRGRTK